MERFAATAERIASHPGKLEKIALLAEYFRDARRRRSRCRSAVLHRTARLRRAIIARSRSAAGRSSKPRGASGHLATRQLGAAIARPAISARRSARSFAPPHDAMLFRDRLTPASPRRSLRRDRGSIRKTREPAARSGSRAHLSRVRRSARCDVRRQDRYRRFARRIARRLGARSDREAFGADPAPCGAARWPRGDVGAVALAAKHGTLAELRVEYGAPIGFMLATPIPYGEAYKELAGTAWHVEDKYDGIRAQAHVRNGTRANLFAPAQRRDQVLSGSCEALASLPHRRDSRR